MQLRTARHLGAISSLSARGHAAPRRAEALAARAAAREQPIELPAEFSWHDYAVFLLSMAAEIEHSLMVQYLYAAYSLSGPADHQKEVHDWQLTILGIAKEEMGHFVTVQNALKLLGGPLHLDRQDYPWNSAFYPYAFTLERLSRESLAKYVVAESPEEWPDSVSHEERTEIETLARESADQQIVRVGALYETIIEILSDADKLPDSLFRAETYPFQASWDEWGRGYAAGARGSAPHSAPDVLVRPAASRTQAVQALKAIAQQGEAVELIKANDEHSHFSRFLYVYRCFSKIDHWSATLPVPTNPRAPGIGADQEGTVIENPEAVQWAILFNLRYRMLLSYLTHAFQLSNDPAQTAAPGRRGQIINRVFGEMYNLKAIAGLLVRLPLKDDLKQRAGPPFQMPYTLSFPANETDFWRLHLDLIEASATQITEVSGIASPAGRAYAQSLRAADEQTAREINVILDADRVASHFLRRTGSVR